MTDAFRVQQLMRQGVLNGVAPAMAFGVIRGRSEAQTWFAGGTPTETTSTCGVHTIFDLASLTKPLTTTLWALDLAERSQLDLNTPIGDVIPMVSAVTGASPIWRLLNHTAGLPAHRRYYEGLGPATKQAGTFGGSKTAVRRMLKGTEAIYGPGEKEVYSDLGFLLLEWICESIEVPLAKRWKSLPGHGKSALHFQPLPLQDRPNDAYAPTEKCPWRGLLLRGEVHDDNAWTMGGICGHAGLFGNLHSVLDIGRRWMRALRGEGGLGGISAGTIRKALSRERWMHPRGTRVLGWDTPTPGRSSSGQFFGRSSVGHLGFTGTSVWLDPDEEVVMVLLTNRVSPSRENNLIRSFRPLIHDAAWHYSEKGFT